MREITKMEITTTVAVRVKRAAIPVAEAYGYGRDYAVAGLSRAQVIQNLFANGYGRVSQARVLRGFDAQLAKG